MLLQQPLFQALLSLTCILNLYLYSYPAVKSCHFPPISNSSTAPPSFWSSFTPPSTEHGAPGSEAPFRLLAFGDPQLEGDTSLQIHLQHRYRPSALIPALRNASSPAAALPVLGAAAADLAAAALPTFVHRWRKRLDLLGNDYYLAHQYRTLRRSTAPTHVAVLGDLLGSQWIDDAEFARRARRFWARVFRGARRVDDAITAAPTIEALGADPAWPDRVINVAGNHDVGYAGDLTPERLARFEQAFGAANWEIVFRVPPSAGAPSAAAAAALADAGLNASAHELPDAFLRLVVLNSMNLDTPAKDGALQTATYDFLNAVIERSQPVEDRRVGTLLLTHIPLHKAAGVCADGPRFEFHGEGEGGGVKEQNHLSYEAGRGAVLEGLYGMSGRADAPYGGLGRQGLILTGHDHEGCDVYHHLPLADPSDAGADVSDARSEAELPARRWNATRWADAGALRAQALPGVREVTLRSMMGEFGGWAHLVSAWYEEGAQLDGTWRFEVARCALGVQHWWWAGHALVVVTAGVGAVLAVLDALHADAAPREEVVEEGGARVTMKKGLNARDEIDEDVVARALGATGSGAAPGRGIGRAKKRQHTSRA